MAMQRYRFNLAADGHVLLMVQGTKFILKESRGPVNVRVLQDGGFLNGLEAGQGFKGQQFKGIEITDASGLANDGYVIISDDEFIDSRVTGDVSVIDGEKARTLAGGRFMGCPYTAQDAAKRACVQLFNPSTTKNLIVTALTYTVGLGNSNVYVYGHDVQLTDSQAGSMANGMVGGAAGVGVPRGEQLASEQTYTYGFISNRAVLSGVPTSLTLSGPLVIPPGKSINVMAYTVNRDISADFEWFEDPV